MAKVVLTVQFADGDSVQAIATGASTYPDALAQLRHEACEGLRDSLAYLLALQTPEVDDA